MGRFVGGVSRDLVSSVIVSAMVSRLSESVLAADCGESLLTSEMGEAGNCGKSIKKINRF